jgi:hypothetical protein
VVRLRVPAVWRDLRCERWVRLHQLERPGDGLLRLRQRMRRRHLQFALLTFSTPSSTSARPPRPHGPSDRRAGRRFARRPRHSGPLHDSNVSYGAVSVGVAYDSNEEVVRYMGPTSADRIAAMLASTRAISKGPRRAPHAGRSLAHGLVPRIVPVSALPLAPSLRQRVLSLATAGTTLSGRLERDVSRAAAASAPPVTPAALGTDSRIVGPELRAHVSDAIRQIAVSNAERAVDISNFMADKVNSDVAALQADESPLALRPLNWDLVRGLLTSSDVATERRVPKTTKKQDRCYWRKWVTFCDLMGTPAIRDDVAATTGADADGYGVLERTLIVHSSKRRSCFGSRRLPSISSRRCSPDCAGCLASIESR